MKASAEQGKRQTSFAQMPNQEAGFSSCGSAEKRYGRPEVVRAMLYISKQ